MNNQPITYMQTDKRWKDKPYRVAGEMSTIGGSGCGPACAAMLIETLTGKTFTPAEACKWSLDHGYKALNQGTYYSYFKPQFAAFGIECEQVSWGNTYGKPSDPIHREALALLQEGYYLIACMGKGLWTASGHFVVLWWEDGTMRINDPASTRAERLNGDPTLFRSQVKYYWRVDARNYNKGDEDMSREEIERLIAEGVTRGISAYEDAVSEAQNRAVSTWAAASWDKAVKAGVFDGTKPTAPMTREQAAVVLDRLGLLG